MRAKLQKFTDFANKLLPHETSFLLATQQLEDQVKLKILEQIHYNCQHIHQFTPYDTSIDKRKYSHLKNWINKRLTAIDIDASYEWKNRLEQKILLDQINQKEEKQLLKYIRHYKHPSFYFIRFFELARQYRNFLLIRMRYSDHQLVDDFLKNHKAHYDRSLLVNEQLHQATADIMGKYAENARESIQWENWLTEIFYDEQLDGFNRYMAMVRLAFISFQYQKAEMLREKLDYLGKRFEEGKFYSRRILLNYYDNRLVMHTKLEEFDEAIYYGYLSIREKNHDYLVYVNNLNSVLIRRGRFQEALSIMHRATADMRETRNFHSKIGFVSHYIRCLLRSGKAKNAKSYAETFLQAYSKEVLQYRWHRFFTTYLEVLLEKEEYPRVLDIIRKYKLIEREKKYQSRTDYIPIILLQKNLAMYQLGDLDERTRKNLIDDLEQIPNLHKSLPAYLKVLFTTS